MPCVGAWRRAQPPSSGGRFDLSCTFWVGVLRAVPFFPNLARCERPSVRRHDDLRREPRALRVWRDQEPLFLGIAHDNPALTPASLLRFNCCVAVFSGLQRGDGAVGIQSVLGGRYAAAVHQGSFATLAQTYGWLARDFLPRHQLVLRRAPAVEIYLTPPDVKAIDGLTEVLLPV